jgi:hypothetical protein
MATNRTLISRPQRGELTHDQTMILLYGYDPRWSSAFCTEEEYQEAWMRNRERILASYRHGRRPQAWWVLEAPIEYPGYDREQSVLFETGLLDEVEAAELAAWWREQYERAWSAHFFHCDGPGRIFEGAIARRKHYKWADIPRSLLKEWTAERRRRGKTIRNLEPSSQPTPT